MHVASILIRSEGLRQSSNFVTILKEITNSGIITERVAIFVVELGYHIGWLIGKQFSEFTFHLSFQVGDSRVRLLQEGQSFIFPCGILRGFIIATLEGNKKLQVCRQNDGLLRDL